MPRKDLIKIRSGTLAQWAAAETGGPALAAGERGYVSDGGGYDVVGDGTKTVAQLQPVGSGAFAPVRSLFGGRFTVVGDSITAGGSNTASLWWDGSWSTHCALASGGSLLHVGNFGHGGFSSGQLVALLDSEPLSVNPDVVGILWGTNDSLDANGRPTQTATNTKAAVAKLRAAGKSILLGTIPPRGSLPLSTPAAPTVTTAPTGGTLAAGTYSYRVAAVDGTGTTLASSATTVTTTGSTSANTITWDHVPGATGYRVYGRTSGSEQFLYAPPAGNGIRKFFVDTGSGAPSGALPASNTTGLTLSTAQHLQVSAINTWLRRYAAQEGIPLADYYAVLSDPQTGRYKVGLTTDGVHPSPTAQKMMGQAAWATLTAYGVIKNASPASLSQTDPTNLYANGLLYSNNGTAPSGGTVSGGTGVGVTTSVAAKSGFAGNAWTIDITNPAADQRIADGAVQVLAGSAVGDLMQVSCVLQVEGAEAGGSEAVVFVRSTSGTPNGPRVTLTHADVGPVVWTAVFPLSAALAAGMYFEAFLTGKGRLSVGQFTVTNLTALAAATP